MMTILAHVRPAAGIMAGAMLSFWSVLAVRDAAGLSLNVVVLAVALAVLAGLVLPGLTPAARLAGLAVVPLAAAAATEVGVLFRTHANAGGAVFVLALAAAVWLRRFGRFASGVGTLMSLPFVATLVAPLPQPSGLRHLLWSAVAAAIAAGWVGLVHVATRPPTGASGAAAATRAVSGRWGLSVSTRMAIQFAAALATALVLGRTLYPDHWVWPVITAYIVCSGNRGRADVLYKGVLRVAGALAGTLVATALLVGVFDAGSAGAVACLFVALAVATTLRPLSYAYWAACVTAALAFLYGYFGQTGSHLLYTRLAGILWGGAAGIAASWLLLPIRGTDVLRARHADVLAALTEVLTAVRRDPAQLPERRDRFDRALAEFDRVAPALVAGERLTARWRGRATVRSTVAALHRCAVPVGALARQAAANPALLRTRDVAASAAALTARVVELRRGLARRPATTSAVRTLPATRAPSSAPTGAGPLADLAAIDAALQSI
jgi:hypothetical protein